MLCEINRNPSLLVRLSGLGFGCSGTTLGIQFKSSEGFFATFTVNKFVKNIISIELVPN